MNIKLFIDYIEDKNIETDNNWYFHATDKNIEIIEKILKEGIKSSYLRKEHSSSGYNGKYYVSICKKNDNINTCNSVYELLEHLPKFIINNVFALKTNKENFKAFSETILPLRTSCYDDEYQVFLKINKSKIIAIEYSLYYLLEINESLIKEELEFLKKMIVCLDKNSLNIPIYDLSTNREINKSKILSLENFEF